MDRNSAIGLTLIAVLLLAYFYWFSPKPEPQSTTPATTSQSPVQDSIRESPQAPSGADSVSIAAADAQRTEETIEIKTEDVRVVLTNKGGIIKELELLKYKTYSQQPLKLVTPARSEFGLLTNLQGKDVDLYQLFYDVDQTRKGDTTVVSFTLPMAGGFLRHVYAIPQKGYEIKYRIEQRGLAEEIGGSQLTFLWNDKIPPTEKDIHDTRNNSSVTYFEINEGFDHLSERSSGTELETLMEPLKWVAIKQKFFLASIIATHHFSGGEVSTITNEADTDVVEYARVKLFIPKTSLIAGETDYKFYIGPNDYQEIGVVAEDFERNVYLGWPPVYWINKFVIFPVFHFLTGVISNYGVIIIVLVLLLKLVLAPLSYRSYLSMAKMRVLKPELDEIKEKHGDDMQKVQQEQLKLYQQVGVNPISGCIPVLLQMPILFAMFYLFPASIELRQQPFLWAEDLSTYDSVINLPFSIPFGVGDHLSLFTLLMTVSTLIYTWQNNQLSSVTGPMKSMSYIMPLIFLFVLNSFPAGLTFYYFVSNLVTFAQQAIIRRFVDEEKIKTVLEENRRRIAAGGAKKSKFMSRLEEAMKASEEARRKAEEERKKRRKK